MSQKFFICLSLLSTIIDYPVNPNPISPNNNVSNMAFAKELSNPCNSIDESGLESVDRQHIDLRTTVLQTIAETSKAIETAKAILKSRDLSVLPCTASVFPPDEKIPLAQHLSNNITVEVVRLFYTSLVNHTAYVFFISEQIEKSTSKCFLDIVLNETGELAAQMKAVMCSFRQLAIALPGGANDSLKDAHEQIFNEELIDLSMCSRLMFGTCMTLQNAQKILTELLCYLRTMGSSQ